MGYIGETNIHLGPEKSLSRDKTNYSTQWIVIHLVDRRMHSLNNLDFVATIRLEGDGTLGPRKTPTTQSIDWSVQSLSSFPNKNVLSFSSNPYNEVKSRVSNPVEALKFFFRLSHREDHVIHFIINPKFIYVFHIFIT